MRQVCRCLAFVLSYFAGMAKAARSCEVLRLEARNFEHRPLIVEKPKLLDGHYAGIFRFLSWPDRSTELVECGKPTEPMDSWARAKCRVFSVSAQIVRLAFNLCATSKRPLVVLVNLVFG